MSRMHPARTILLVDDDATVLMMLARQLRLLGYGVHTAGTAAAALKLMEHAGRFDLVLIDIIMPGMNGTELGGLVLDRAPHQSIVLMSAYAPSGLAEVRAGTNLIPVLKKPIDAHELTRLLDLALSGAGTPAL